MHVIRGVAVFVAACVVAGTMVGCLHARMGDHKRGLDRNEAAMADYLEAQSKLAVVECSDWINVKTDVEPAAVGDGVTDDTAAIQAALSMLEGKQPATRVVYLPPGTYRITQTLSVTHVQGGAIYGHGRATVLLWDGEAAGDPVKSKHGAEAHPGPRMFHSNGFGRNLYFGLTFDGAGKAAVGVDHRSDNYYETRVRYQYCAFRNLVDSGIRVGLEQVTASAEMMFHDCLFEHCGRGVSFLEFNDYDNSFARCIFRNNGSGIYCHRGNVYVHDCHFENSREADLLLPPHSHSIRRCTSRGSRSFVRPAQGGAHPLLLAVQDCHVSGWTDPDAAMRLVNRGPVLVFDSVFADPAVAGSAAVELANDRQWEQTLITANLQTPGVEAAVKPGVNALLHSIGRETRGMLIEEAADFRWRHRLRVPGRIFDAKRDFGAAGDGRTDDTQAVQAAIDAARAHGRNALAYLPAGSYAIGKTLRLEAGDYSFGGALAWHTRLAWSGGAGGTVLHADDADGVAVRQLRIDAPKELAVTGLLATAGRPGRLELDGVFSGGGWQPEFRGTVLRDLPAGFAVYASHVDGDAHVERCGDARILFETWFAGYDGPFTVSGGTGDGFLGVNSAAASHGKPDLTVNDSSSIVFGDYYTEQTHQVLQANGNPGDRPGQVTISYAKLGCEKPEKIRIEGYEGLVTLSRANMMYYPTTFVGKGGVNTTLLLLGNSFNPDAPDYALQDVALHRLGCNIWNHEDKTLNRVLPDTDPAAAAEVINAALDHFRALSRVNLGRD